MLKNRFPNQYKVVINKEKVSQNDAEKRYFLAYQETIEAAASELNGNEFKLYIYFLANKDGYESFFSPTDVKRCYGMSEDTARKAFHKLIELGYLVKTAAHDVEFYDKPKKKEPTVSLKVEKRYVVDDDNITQKWSYSEFKAAALKGGDYTDEEIRDAWNNCEVVKED